MKLNMTVADALEFADEWVRGMTLHEGSQGWRVVCMVLAEEVRRLSNESERIGRGTGAVGEGSGSGSAL